MNTKVFFSKITAAVLCLVAVACQSKDNSSSEDIIHIPLAEEKVMDVNQLIDSVELIALETPDSILLSANNNTTMIKFDQEQDLFFILDKHLRGLYIFDRQGHFVRQIGQGGQGPKDYLEPCAFILQPDQETLLIVDDGGAKVLYYNYDGTYVKTINLARDYVGLSMNDALLTAENHLALFLPLYNEQNQINLLGGSTFEDLITSVSYKPFKCTGSVNQELGPQGLAKDNDNDLLFIKMFNDTIYAISGDKIRPKYQVEQIFKPIEVDKLEKTDFAETNGSYEIWSEAWDTGHCGGFQAIATAGRYILLNANSVMDDRIRISYYVIDTKEHKGYYLPRKAFLDIYQTSNFYASGNDYLVSLSAAHTLLKGLSEEEPNIQYPPIPKEIRPQVEALHLKAEDNPVVILYHIKP